MSEHNVKHESLFKVLLLALTVGLYLAPALSRAATPVDVWWPTNGVHVSGTQPLKAMVQGMDVSSYTMYWQVDGGQWNVMQNNYTGYQHKEADISVAGWNWRGAGPYTINFIAQKNNQTIATQSEQIYIDQPTQNVTPQQNSALQSPVQLSAAPNFVKANTSTVLYVNPNSDVAQSGIAALTQQPTATWFGNWNNNIQSDVHTLVASAAAQNATPVLVAYNIPGRDCGGYSSGGSNNSAAYTAWIQAFAAGIGTNKAMVVLEPDALASASCLSAGDQATRLSLIKTAVQTLKQNANTHVYIDAGHAGWVDANTMATRLAAADIAEADGFALNVSNFDTTSSEASYGAQISSALQNKTGTATHFVIDTSRNGNGSNGQWCNPTGAAIGHAPTTDTGNALVDAYLWVKTPGESDGTCNGGPSAGVWWQTYAQALVNNAH